MTGDTICDSNTPIVLESMAFPSPVMSIAIEPQTKSDIEKMNTALAKLAEEDPTFKVHQDPETGQTLLSGMGELHLEIIVDRLVREFKVSAEIGQPQVHTERPSSVLQYPTNVLFVNPVGAVNSDMWSLKFIH